MTDSEHARHESNPAPRKPAGRRFWLAIPVLLLMLGGTLAALPSIVSSDWGRSAILDWFNRSIPGEVRVDALSLSWLDGQSLRGLAIHDGQGQPVLRLDSLTSDLSLFQALRGRLTLGQTVLRNLQADLTFGPDGGSNLNAALGATADAPRRQPGGLVPPVTSNMALIDSRVRITAPGIEPVELDNLSGAVEMTDYDSPLKLSFGGRSRQDGLEGSITLNGQITQLFDDRELRPGNARARLDATIENLPVDALDRLLGGRGMLSATIGHRITLHLRADGDSERQNLALTASAPRAELEVHGLIDDDHFSLSEPASARLEITPRAVQAINRLNSDDSVLQLASSVPLHLSVEQLNIPLQAPDRSQIALRAGLDARGRIQFIGIREIGEVSIDDLRLVVDSPGLGEAIRVKLHGQPQTRGQGGSLALDADIRGLLDNESAWQPARAKVHAESSITGIPTTLLDKLLGQGGLLVEALGPVFGLELSTDTDDTGSMRVTASLDAPNLQAGPLRFSVDDAVALTQAGSVEFGLTPGLWRRIGGIGQLAGPVHGELALQRLRLPLPYSHAGVTLEAHASLATLTLAPRTGAAIFLKENRLSFGFDGRNQGRADFEMSAKLGGQDGTGGELSLSVNADRLLDADGALAAAPRSLDLEGRFKQLPAALIDPLLGMNGLLAATLGPLADIDITARLEDMRGPVTLALDTSYSRADVIARMEDRGLTLSETMVARLEPTPELGSQVLARIHPIFETTQRAERPIRLEVPAEGVLVPIQDFDFAAMVVPEMTLDFGTLILKSGWLLRGIVGLGQQFGKLESVGGDEFEAWFTPAALQINSGRILYTRRLDLLLDRRLHLATWGSADVSRDRSELTLAFMPDTMERVFSIAVAENDALYMPITGPLSAPAIDFKKTATDLVRLRAQEEVAGEDPLAGALLGALGSKLTGHDEAPPPPSVMPLPWAELLQSRPAANPAPPAGEQPEARQTPEQTQQPDAQPSTEERVIRGLIDIFGGKKEQ